MLSAQELIDTLNNVSPEAKSRAIVALQDALQKQANVMQAVKQFLDTEDRRPLEKAWKAYNRI